MPLEFVSTHGIRFKHRPALGESFSETILSSFPVAPELQKPFNFFHKKSPPHSHEEGFPTKPIQTNYGVVTTRKNCCTLFRIGVR